jgi:putative glutathione S-transferase
MFRERVAADGSTPFSVEAGRYHLYVSYACPWAHRTLIARSMLGLQDAIGLSVSHPLMLDEGWVFAEGQAEIPDPIHGIDYLYQLYVKARPDYNGRATVPVLWDNKRETIVSNESRDILRMFATEFQELATSWVDLSPPDYRDDIDAMIDANYETVNNGVYKAGFARSQKAHAEAATELFDRLDACEEILSRQRFLCGDRLTEADICLFTTLLRFDAVYATHFKCNIRRVVDYPNLWGYLRDIYQRPVVEATCRLDHIKQHYYGSHRSLNPHGIIPLGPAIDYDAPHERDRFA